MDKSSRLSAPPDKISGCSSAPTNRLHPSIYHHNQTNLPSSPLPPISVPPCPSLPSSVKSTRPSVHLIPPNIQLDIMYVRRRRGGG